MSRSAKVVLVFVSIVFSYPNVGVAQKTSLIREAGEQIIKALTKYVGKSGTRTLTEELAELGGREGAEAIAKRISREAGEEGLSKVLRLTRLHGPDVLRVLDNTPSPSAILKALDELPAEEVVAGIRRLAAGTQGKELGEMVERYGSAALRTEIAHPGVGTKIVRTLGDEGIALSQKLGKTQLMEVSKHADDIAQLPVSQKNGILKLLYSDTERMTQFMGRFLEKNPGKILFTSATTAVILTNSKKVLGGSEIAFDKNGDPYVIEKRGLIERTYHDTLNSTVKLVFIWVAPVVALGLFGWIGIRLRNQWKRSALKTASKVKRNRSH